MASENQASQPLRPNIMGRRHVIVAGHYLAAQAGLQVLEAGGNAIDAGVAAGIALGVVESEMVSFAGVAPIILYIADTEEVVTISGLGGWPRAASCEYFHQHHGGTIPDGIARTVVPGAPDAWITALERYGTMGFGEVAAAAIRFAREGIAMYPLLADWIASQEETLRAWPTNAAVFLPQGRPPRAGEIFVQEDLGRTLQFLADEEAAQATNGRAAGLAAVRRAFYRGDVAAAIVKFHAENGGLMTAADLADFRVGIEPPVKTRFHDIEVYGCGPWCQGPMLLQSLNIVEGLDLAALGHNTPAYIHALTEAIKLAAADRDAYYGDPRFVDVPMAALLDKDYAARRRALIRRRRGLGGDAGGGRRGTATVRRPGSGGTVWQTGGRQTGEQPRYVLRVRRRQGRQCLFGDAQRQRTANPAYPRSGLGAIGARRPVVDRSRSSLRHRAGQATAADAQSGLGDPPRQNGHAFRHAGRRRADPDDAASVHQPLRLRHGSADGGRVSAFRHPQLSGVLRASRL